MANINSDTNIVVYKHYSQETASSFNTIMINPMTSNEYYFVVYCPFHCTTYAIRWLLSKD